VDREDARGRSVLPRDPERRGLSSFPDGLGSTVDGRDAGDAGDGPDAASWRNAAPASDRRRSAHGSRADRRAELRAAGTFVYSTTDGTMSGAPTPPADSMRTRIVAVSARDPPWQTLTIIVHPVISWSAVAEIAGTLDAPRRRMRRGVQPDPGRLCGRDGTNGANSGAGAGARERVRRPVEMVERGRDRGTGSCRRHGVAVADLRWLSWRSQVATEILRRAAARRSPRRRSSPALGAPSSREHGGAGPGTAAIANAGGGGGGRGGIFLEAASIQLTGAVRTAVAAGCERCGPLTVGATAGGTCASSRRERSGGTNNGKPGGKAASVRSRRRTARRRGGGGVVAVGDPIRRRADGPT
jgi:hypothetical protein